MVFLSLLKLDLRKITFLIKGDVVKSYDMFDSKNISKGLLAVAKELELIDDNENPRLNDLREIISRHPAFDSKTKLDRLAAQYSVKIVWCHCIKFHCELNTIEGLWCNSKHYVRQQNEQDYSKLLDLIQQSFKDYEESTVHVKLWNRFWETLHIYDSGATYADVLHKLF